MVVEQRLICNDCGLAVSDRWTGTLCPLLDRAVDPNAACQVSIQGVLWRVRDNERLRDEADQLEEDEDGWFEWERIQKLRDEVALWTGALKHLWGRTKAPNRGCPTCGWVPFDSTVYECHLHKLPLRLMLRR